MESFTKFAGLESAVVLVTGGATGIGSAIVETFAQQGSRVIFLDLDADASAELVARLGPRAKIIPEFVSVDLKDLHMLKATLESIQERVGPVRVLVNNAANDERHEIPCLLDLCRVQCRPEIHIRRPTNFLHW
jgi:D-xylose 1-dehydrogenase